MKLADESMVRRKCVMRVEMLEVGNKEVKMEVERLTSELSAIASAIEVKAATEVARATIAFNEKHATELLEVAAHFDAKLVAELAAASTAVEVKHAAEFASALAEFEENICATQRVCQDKLVAKIIKVQKYKEKYEKKREKCIQL